MPLHFLSILPPQSVFSYVLLALTVDLPSTGSPVGARPIGHGGGRGSLASWLEYCQRLILSRVFEVDLFRSSGDGGPVVNWHFTHGTVFSQIVNFWQTKVVCSYLSGEELFFFFKSLCISVGSSLVLIGRLGTLQEISKWGTEQNSRLSWISGVHRYGLNSSVFFTPPLPCLLSV